MKQQTKKVSTKNKSIYFSLMPNALCLVPIFAIFFANFAFTAGADEKFDFAYGKVSYIESKLPANFNHNALREKCLTFIKFLKKGNMESRFKPMDYYYFEPDKKNLQKGEKVPLVVFLHGMAEGGHDVKVLFRHPQPLVFIDPENQQKYPCYFLAPQQYERGIWMGYTNISENGNSSAMQTVINIIRKMQERFPDIDKKRVYITGLSSGGHGTCEALMKNPGVFAAGVPIAGGLLFKGKPQKKQKVGIWSFWNDNEHSGTRKSAVETLKAFAASGAECRYTKFHPEIKPRFSRHFSWAWAYAEPDLIPWLFSHKLEK